MRQCAYQYSFNNSSYDPGSSSVIIIRRPAHERKHTRNMSTSSATRNTCSSGMFVFVLVWVRACVRVRDTSRDRYIRSKVTVSCFFSESVCACVSLRDRGKPDGQRLMNTDKQTHTKANVLRAPFRTLCSEMLAFIHLFMHVSVCLPIMTLPLQISLREALTFVEMDVVVPSKNRHGPCVVTQI